MMQMMIARANDVRLGTQPTYVLDKVYVSHQEMSVVYEQVCELWDILI